MSQGVVFTDIDGTLIDIFTGQFDATRTLVKKLTECRIPLILCSSKTKAEQELIREEAELSEPFIVENGGAIFLPSSYFDGTLNFKARKIDKYQVIELGKPAAIIMSKLKELRENYDLDFTAASEMSIDELCKIALMEKEAALRMIQREYGETIVEINNRDFDKFVTKVEDVGLKVISGGRFMDVTGGNNKGTAVKVLIDLFKHKYKNKVVFFGIGDSPNDESMLQLVDFPMLVQRTDGTWQSSHIERIMRLKGVGPEGWKLAFNEIMNYFKR